MITTQIEKINTPKRLQEIIYEVKKQNKKIGFVPTMGALHKGHLKLIKKAKSECDFVVVSIFINPTQFNNQDDFNNYPEKIEEDIALINDYADVVFTPNTENIYTDNLLKNYSFGDIEKVMEGPNRPGHFKGVANVVHRLLDIVKADNAYFGEKDFQQLSIIKKLVDIENISVEIIPVETERNSEGLALSSRNALLSASGLKKGTLIYKNLVAIKKGIKENKSIQELKNQAIENLESENFKIEYLEIRDEQNLTLINEKTYTTINNFRIFIVAWLEGVRLIDNIKL